VKSPKANNIVELRQLLAEKFPGVRMEAGPAMDLSKRWPTGLPQFDSLLAGGVVRSGITEIISGGIATGSSLFLSALVRQAHANGEWLALVDAMDSFDAAALDQEILRRFLWVRCSNAKEAIKATDILLHDGTIPITVLDLISCPAGQLRKIPSSTWFRLQRLLETSSTACVVLTPEPMISNAELRLILEQRFTLESLENNREALFAQIAPRIEEAADGRRRIVRIA
jgi:hypothetical protein